MTAAIDIPRGRARSWRLFSPARPRKPGEIRRLTSTRALLCRREEEEDDKEEAFCGLLVFPRAALPLSEGTDGEILTVGSGSGSIGAVGDGSESLIW